MSWYLLPVLRTKTCYFFIILFVDIAIIFWFMLFFSGLIQGRIMSKRSSSSKLLFYDLHGSGAKIQVMTDARYVYNYFASLLAFILWVVLECLIPILLLPNHTPDKTVVGWLVGSKKWMLPKKHKYFSNPLVLIIMNIKSLIPCSNFHFISYYN